jgi:DHA1 family bicyclomycin/chloramphenicol resistance-like MFS transporter
MFGGGILVSPLLALADGNAVPMAAVVAGGAIAALVATAVLARPVRANA